MFGADLPGIDKARSNHNFQLYDRLLVVPPEGSAAAVRERFVAYELGPSNEDVGTVVIPVAVLQVVRAPRNGEPAVVEVRELFGSLNADTRVMPLDTAGMNVRGRPVAVPDGSGRNARLLEIHDRRFSRRSTTSCCFSLTSADGMRVGDEVSDLSRARRAEGRRRADAARGRDRDGRQVVRVTAYGSTARITSQDQPAIRTGREHPSGRAHALTAGGHALRLNAVTRGHALH